jgi:hypothetical protein
MVSQDAYDGDGGPFQPQSSVETHETSAGETVFAEVGNDEGWIITDHTVDVRR